MQAYSLTTLDARSHKCNGLLSPVLKGVSCLSSSDMASAEAAVQEVPLGDMSDEELQVRVRLFRHHVRHATPGLEDLSIDLSNIVQTCPRLMRLQSHHLGRF